MTSRSLKIDAVWKSAVLIIAAIALVPCAWLVMRWCMAGSAVERATDTELALYLTNLAPDDPQTHHAAAVQLEKSFDPADVEKALHEFEITVSLAPENYQFWLDLGRARERNGDTEGSEAALRRSLALAPNYSRVQWALGNALLRQGRIDEAFAEIRKAVAGDAAFAGPATTAAWQFFDGDLARIRSAMGASSNFDASLAELLAREKRFEEAVEIWHALPKDERETSLKEVGKGILGQLLEAKRFRDAVRLSSEINGTPERAGQVTNGGFEAAVKPEGAGIFEWQISPGFQPQIVLNTSQKHGGNNSLLIVFNSTEAKDFRTVTQAVALDPGRTYELEIFYRSDLKTSAVFNWEVADAGNGGLLAATEPLAPRTDWARASARFTLSPKSDGVVIRLSREGCGQVCAVAGNLWLDDIAIKLIS